MSRIKCIIIDDDVFTREQLKDKLLSLFPDDIVVQASCENGIEGMEAVRKFNPSLVFLDIQMPGITGFQMLDALDRHDFEVVFITSFNQYAITAIRYSALDYLLKPIDDDDLQGAIARFREKTNALTLKSRLQNLMHNIASADPANLKLLIPTRQGEKNIPVSDIIRCEADSNYTHFFLKDKTKFTSSKTLKEYEGVLSQNDFVRVHKSHIVNKNHIDSIRDESCIVMSDKSEVEISRRRLAEVKSAIQV